MGREFELKFRATAAQQAAIRNGYAHWEEIRMETTYYDTSDHALSDRHVTLRRRLENGRSVCTVKTPAAGLGRGEWECRSDNIEDAIWELCKLGAPAELEKWTAAGIAPICGARFTRLCHTVEGNGCTVELALDSGVLLGGGIEIPLCEVEVEHKSGSEEATLGFAQTLAEEFGLIPEKKSKFRRALSLAMER